MLDLVFIINFKMGVSRGSLCNKYCSRISGILCLIYSYKKFKVLRLKKEDFKVESSIIRTT